MATPNTQTLLSLDEYAAIMGLNPLNFNSAASANENLYGFETDKQPLWFKYDWQAASQMSHERLANLIRVAEEDIANLLGYWPAPKWITHETIRYPGNIPIEDVSLAGSSQGTYKPVAGVWKKVISVGQRKATKIGTVTVAGGSLVYSDEDLDNFDETATITIATTVTDVKKIKVYFANKNADPLFEVRPPRSISIAGGVATIVFYSWQLFLRELYEALPGGEPITINADDSDNYVISLDVYEIDVDTTVYSARFIWDKEESELGLVTQEAYLKVLDYDNAIFSPTPAEYSSSDGVWNAVSFSKSYLPNMVQLWYYAGLRSDRYIAGYDFSPMEAAIKQAVAWLATARMDNTFKANNNIIAIVDSLRREAAEQRPDNTFFLGPNALNSPLGTRVGEIYVWRMLKNRDRKYSGGLV